MTPVQVQWIQDSLAQKHNAAMAWCDDERTARSIIKETEDKMAHAEQLFGITLDYSFLEEEKTIFRYR